MSPWAALAIFAAGLGAGTINTIVGSGSLVTFPTLLALGYPPLLANVSNNVGLVPGTVSGALAYRRELTGQRSRVLRLGAASLLGGVAGAALLLGLPGTVFRSAVPALILVAALLMAFQPRLSKILEARGDRKLHGGFGLFLGVFLTGVYGGYFGAAQGVILIALLAIFVHDDLQRLNGTKNVLAMLVNTAASGLFIIFSTLSWSVVALIAAGSVIGGQLGARIGRRLPAAVLRAVIVVVGVVVACILFAEWY
ncbi:MAG: sulfite exporter TauE/SafE family protein [Acidimicrobiales bacterium]